MRHRKKLKKLGLPKSHRESLLRNLIASLVLHGHLRTTESRAKALAQRFARLMHIVKTHEKREAIRLLPQYCSIRKAGEKLVNELKEQYKTRSSGFTRITPIGMRKGDNASLVYIELL